MASTSADKNSESGKSSSGRSRLGKGLNALITNKLATPGTAVPVGNDVTQTVKEAASEGGSIIATGGGVVLREENVRALKRNGVLVFIDRPLDLLQATADRPFSADPEALKKRYEERYDIYCYTADYRVDGSGSAEEVAGQILRMLNIETN